MPNLTSAKKNLRKNNRRAKSNYQVETRLASLLKKTRQSIHAKKNEDAKKLFHDLSSSLDRAAQRNIIKHNHAARLKSRVQKMINLATQKV